MIDPQIHYLRKMLRLLGFPKAKPESGPGCSYCLAGRLSVQSQGAGGPCTKASWAPGGSAAAGSDGSPRVYIQLPSPGTKRRGRRRDVTVLMTEIYSMIAQNQKKKFSQPVKDLVEEWLENEAA